MNLYRKLISSASSALPKQTAMAACPPDPYYQYMCFTDRKYYRRRCQTPGSCGPDQCGPYVYYKPTCP